MATWPATLPNPQTGMKVDPAPQTIATDMEVGAARVRRRTSHRVDVFAVTWQFTDAQMDTFRTWFDGDGAGGAAWFTLTIPDGYGGLNAVSARFKGTFGSSVDDAFVWTVTASLEVQL